MTGHAASVTHIHRRIEHLGRVDLQPRHAVDEGRHDDKNVAERRVRRPCYAIHGRVSRRLDEVLEARKVARDGVLFAVDDEQGRMNGALPWLEACPEMQSHKVSHV